MSELMGYMRLNEAFQYVDDELLDLVEQEKKKKKKPMLGFAGTVAACICVLLLPVGVMATRLFGLWDLLLQRGDNDITYLTVSDYFMRPEVLALREWEEFLAEYDTDRSILSDAMETGFAPEGREDWLLYGVYSYEMGEKLDEIVKRSGLVLNNTMDTISFEELQNRVGGSFIIDADIEEYCQVYEYGSFQFKGNAEPVGGGKVAFEFHCVVKGTFDDKLPLWLDYNSMDEWRYETACGESVWLALGASHAMILTEARDRYLMAVVPDGREIGITEEMIQGLADRIDFRMIKDMQLPETGSSTPVSTVSVISLHGYMDSPESRALLEWREFLTQYDADHKISNIVGNDVFIAEGRDDWAQYSSVYSYEMGEKLDEIVEKYGLKLHTAVNYVDSDELMYRADDFVNTETNPLEIVARMKAQIRRYTQLTDISGNIERIYRIDGLEVDDIQRRVTVSNREILLTSTEYKILRFLVNEKGRVHSVDEIYEAVWGMQPIGAENTMAVHIRHIRKKIEENPAEPHYLKVAWGKGYMVG